MLLEKAYQQSKAINKQQNNISVSITKSPYGGYRLHAEPIELSIIRNSLKLITSSKRSFIENYGLKYAR